MFNGNGLIGGPRPLRLFPRLTRLGDGSRGEANPSLACRLNPRQEVASELGHQSTSSDTQSQHGVEARTLEPTTGAPP